MATYVPSRIQDFPTFYKSVDDLKTLLRPSGLRRWRQRKAKRAFTGIDIIIGPATDSKGEGTGNSNYFNRWPHVFKYQVQEAFNPIGPDGQRIGGFGYFPVRLGDNSRNGAVGTEGGGMTYGGDTAGDLSCKLVGTAETYNGSGTGTATRSSYINGGSTNYYLFTVKGSAVQARWKRSRITSFELVARRATDGGTCRVDVNEVASGEPTAGGGIVLSTTVNTNGSSRYGEHWGIIGEGTLDPTKDYYVRVTAPSDGSKLYLDGLIFYCYDELKGIRVHNIAHAGTKSTAMVSSVGVVDSGQLYANITAWSTVAPTDSTTKGARRAALFISNYLTNDQSGTEPPLNSLADWLANMGAVYDAQLAATSVPCVMFLNTPIAAGAGATNRYNQCLTWIPAMLATLETKGNGSMLDMWGGYSDSTGTQPTRAAYIDAFGLSFDALHENDGGQQMVADDLYRALFGVTM